MQQLSLLLITLQGITTSDQVVHCGCFFSPKVKQRWNVVLPNVFHVGMLPKKKGGDSSKVVQGPFKNNKTNPPR